MRYKAKRSAAQTVGSALMILLLSAAFIGSFVLVGWLTLRDCHGDRTAAAILSAAMNRVPELMITGLLCVVGFVILFFQMKPPARYYGTVTKAEQDAAGRRSMEFSVSPNSKTKAATPSQFSFVTDADCPLHEGDACIARIKEASWTLISVEAADRSDADTVGVRTESRSMGGFMDLLFVFLTVLFAVVGVLSVIGGVMSYRKSHAPAALLVAVIPAIFCAAAVVAGLKMRKAFRRDNDPAATRQEPTGFGLEAGVPLLASRLHIRRETFQTVGHPAALLLTDDAGTSFGKIRPMLTGTGLEILGAGQEHLGTVTLHLTEQRYTVSLDGLQPFSVRRRLHMDYLSANYEIEGLDFTVEGIYSEMTLRTLDGALAAVMQRESRYHLLIEAADSTPLNLYAAVIAACILHDGENHTHSVHR